MSKEINKINENEYELIKSSFQSENNYTHSEVTKITSIKDHSNEYSMKVKKKLEISSKKEQKKKQTKEKKKHQEKHNIRNKSAIVISKKNSKEKKKKLLKIKVIINLKKTIKIFKNIDYDCFTETIFNNYKKLLNDKYNLFLHDRELIQEEQIKVIGNIKKSMENKDIIRGTYNKATSIKYILSFKNETFNNSDIDNDNESIKDLYKKNNQTSKNCVKIININSFPLMEPLNQFNNITNDIDILPSNSESNIFICIDNNDNNNYNNNNIDNNNDKSESFTNNSTNIMNNSNNNINGLN
ncbi:hypothetical protein H8356DRAFT_1338128 [Neocallimastix lanati (nom. inval.)]|nr:hypothetical protein H8356DRAFT_1338128 [Neocallimastix sp. JGI-2020a]